MYEYDTNSPRREVIQSSKVGPFFKLGSGVLLTEVRRDKDELRKTLYSGTDYKGFA